MITEFKAGTLYKLSPKHHLYWDTCQSASLIFLCTEKIYSPIIDTEGEVHYPTQKAHLLINVDTGGVWATKPRPPNYEEYLQ